MNWKWEMIKLWFKFTVLWIIGFIVIGLISEIIGNPIISDRHGSEDIERIFTDWYIVPIGLYLAYRFIKFVLKGNEYSKKVNETLLINRDNYAKEVNKEIYYFN
jgi:hypothetical protein